MGRSFRGLMVVIRVCLFFFSSSSVMDKIIGLALQNEGLEYSRHDFSFHLLKLVYSLLF